MATATVNGLTIAYEVIGDGRPWVDHPGRPLQQGLPGRARAGRGAGREPATGCSIWDRPNTGASDVCFTGPSESAMQADVLAGLLSHLDMTPAVIAGGSGGSRVSLLDRHPPPRGRRRPWPPGGSAAASTASWSSAPTTAAARIRAAWTGGMEAVAALPEWQRGARAQPRRTGSGSSTRTRRSSSPPSSAGWSPTARAATSWCPGLPDADGPRPRRPGPRVPQRRQRRQPHAGDVRAGRRRCSRTPASSSPRGATTSGTSARRPGPGGAGEGLFVRWPLLAPTLLGWADDVLE